MVAPLIVGGGAALAVGAGFAPGRAHFVPIKRADDEREDLDERRPPGRPRRPREGAEGEREGR